MSRTFSLFVLCILFFTYPSSSNEVFKYFASVRRTPSALVLVNRSLPAKSHLQTNQQNGVKFIYLLDWSKQSIRGASTTLMRFRIKTHTFLFVFAYIHTKTTENTDQNGGFRKLFQMWSALTTHRFENVPFLVWTGENGDDGHDEKSVIYCRFHQRFQAV